MSNGSQCRKGQKTPSHCDQRKHRLLEDMAETLGAHYRNNKIDKVGTEQDIEVATIIPHKMYNELTNSHDIALIKLLRPAELGVGVGLVCLPDIAHELPFDNDNETCRITGWGHTAFGGPKPDELLEASVPLVSEPRCTKSYPGLIDDSMLCAGFDDGGVDTCTYDSGGPLVCKFNGTWYLEGVTNWGYKCAKPRKYGVYANVRHFKKWISGIINAPHVQKRKYNMFL
ncbi:hypothetical protein ACROYT_G029510 [Oculina patagonica]